MIMYFLIGEKHMVNNRIAYGIATTDMESTQQIWIPSKLGKQ